MAAAREIAAELDTLADPERAELVAPYLGVAPGGYGEGDVLLGIAVPEQRKVAGRHRDAPLGELARLLASPIHEHRLVALVILTLRFKRADEAGRDELSSFFLAHRDRVNNWDLVDLSARILLHDRVRADPRGLLDRLLASPRLWDRRMAVLATFSLIKEDQFAETLRCAEALLSDDEDLIHKAVGWMLREVGKRDESVLRAFLDRQAAAMPRTMLRYSLERLPKDARDRYMGRTG